MKQINENLSLSIHRTYILYICAPKLKMPLFMTSANASYFIITTYSIKRN